MKSILILLCIVACATSSLHAAPPTKETVEKLLEVTETKKLLDSMYTQIDKMMQNAIAQNMPEKALGARKKQISERVQAQMMTVIKEELGWERMKDVYVQVYTETFSQEEIEGLIAFYESPAGRAFVTKMPVVMQKSMAMTQQRMAPIMEKMQKVIQDAAREAAAE